MTDKKPDTKILMREAIRQYIAEDQVYVWHHLRAKEDNLNAREKRMRRSLESLNERLEKADEEEAVPTFYAKQEKDRPASLSFTCPKCGKVNRHGKARDVFGSGDGHRFSHCTCWKRGYYIKECEVGKC